MVKFNWTPTQIREIELPTLMHICWGLENEIKEMKKQQSKMKTKMPHVRRRR